MDIYTLCGDLLKKVDKKQLNFKNAFFELKEEKTKTSMKVLKKVYEITLNCLKKLNILKDSFPDVIQTIKRNMPAKE